MKEEDSSEYWNRKWGLREQRLRENVILDGSDGEDEFDRELAKKAEDRDVLDVGCGPGEFTLRTAKRAQSIIGVDSSRTALTLAKWNLAKSSVRNVSFRYGDIRQLPFQKERFDLAYSRRGPASENKHSLAEVLRVLRRGGTFMEITIGERDKQNITEIFGRGQMLDFQGQVFAVKRRWLEEVGFSNVRARDYFATEVFRTMNDLIIRLKTAPIIPSFDLEKDRGFLAAVKEKCTTKRGIETPVHRVILMARK